MTVTATLHADETTKFNASFVTSRGNRAVKIVNATGDVCVFLTDDQARQLAETILRAIYPETAAMADAVGEVVQ